MFHFWGTIYIMEVNSPLKTETFFKISLFSNVVDLTDTIG